MMMGVETTQKEICKRAEAGLYKRYINGLEPDDLKKSAKSFGFKLNEINLSDENNFLKNINTYFDTGRPLILLVENFTHWVAVLGKIDNEFIICDPYSNKVYKRWGEKKLLKKAKGKNGDCLEYCALIFSDSRKPFFKLSNKLLELCSNGSDEYLFDITDKDLKS
jgi:ABC-type bacteriocin/lantibiotic exporter with double-glycine peptidase domain